MDMKIRRRHSNGKWYLVRPYLKPNLDDIGNVTKVAKRYAEVLKCSPLELLD